MCRTSHASVIAALLLALALAVTGCGGTRAARSAPAVTAKVVAAATAQAVAHDGTSPGVRAASERPRTATTAARGRHVHVGELCSGRDEARFASEGMFCVAGRLTLNGQVHRTGDRRGEVCSSRRGTRSTAAGSSCDRGRLIRR